MSIFQSNKLVVLGSDSNPKLVAMETYVLQDTILLQ